MNMYQLLEKTVAAYPDNLFLVREGVTPPNWPMRALNVE